ncbi:unnamed protein product [Fraxinus pennsylvanica]|uniref:Sororin C-terminal region domain-containing protein n=1 Tax=Fraxinus pennsylvanica TaxID=56036 RepID=A0AAD2E2C9_9LAMI|nr:unnamed protein product [Fraxinus pennsylvanica]
METRKRKPLSDLTNSFNLISTSTLRKLASSKTPYSILKSNPSSKTEKLCSDSDTRSGTSIGSSNVSAARNSHTVQFSTDPCRPLSSIASSGDGKTKNGASSRRQTTYVPQKKREVVAATLSFTPLLKMKDKGKAITVPSYCPPPEKTEDYGNPIRGSCSSLEKEMEKVKGNLSPNGYTDKVEVRKEIPSHSSCSLENGEKGKTILNTSGCSIEKTKELRMGILNPSNCSYDRRKERGVVTCRHNSSLYKTKEIGKTILNPSSSSVEKTKDKGKAVLNASGCSIEKTKGLILNPFSSSYEERKERGVVIHSPSGSSLEKTKEIRKTILYPSIWAEKTNDKGKTVLNPFGCSIEKTEEKGKSILNPFGSSLEATKKRGKAILIPSSVEKIKDKGASATEPVNYTSWRRKSGKRTIDIAASSCPPLLKTKNGFNESQEVKPSKSWTDLHDKLKKKRCMQQKGANEFCLPPDFIEKQRAYFEEVDKFELPVEEV